MPLLPPEAINELVELLVAQGAVTQPWLDNLFALLPASFRAELPVPDVPKERLVGSLARLNDQTAPIEGAIPLAVVLDQLTHDPVAEVVQRAKQLLNRLTVPGPGT